jgi:hypothetical protein
LGGGAHVEFVTQLVRIVKNNKEKPKVILKEKEKCGFIVL